MKIKNIILIGVVFFSLMLTAHAEDILLKDIYDNLKIEESNVNSTNDIYISQINYDDHKITITYAYKDNASLDTYLNPEKFVTSISGENIITFLTGADSYYEDDPESLKDTSKIVALDNTWFEKLVAVLNHLTNNQFTPFNEVKNKEVYCNSVVGMCYLNSTRDIKMAYFKAQFRININYVEVEDITSNRASLNVSVVDANHHSSMVCSGDITLYEIVNDQLVSVRESKDNSIHLTDLKPATKYTYYAANPCTYMSGESKEELETYCNLGNCQKIEFTTLEDPNLNQEVSDKPTDNQETIDKSTDNQEFENPNTGNELPIITIMISLILAILLFVFSKKNRKLF